MRVVDNFGIPEYFHHLKNADASRDQKELAMEVTSKKLCRCVWLVTSVGQKMLGEIISPEQSNERQMTSLRDESKPTRKNACILADDYRGPRGRVDKQFPTIFE